MEEMEEMEKIARTSSETLWSPGITARVLRVVRVAIVTVACTGSGLPGRNRESRRLRCALFICYRHDTQALLVRYPLVTRVIRRRVSREMHENPTLYTCRGSCHRDSSQLSYLSSPLRILGSIAASHDASLSLD